MNKETLKAEKQKSLEFLQEWAKEGYSKAYRTFKFNEKAEFNKFIEPALKNGAVWNPISNQQQNIVSILAFYLSQD